MKSSSHAIMLFNSIATVGCGFSGLAISNFVASLTKSLTLVKSSDHSASAMSAGLMHPLTPQGKIIWKGLEGYEETLSLILSCQQYIKVPILDETQLLRPLIDQSDLVNFESLAKAQPELVEMVSLTRLAEILGMPHPTAIGCCNIKKAIIVNPEAYLTGLSEKLNQEHSHVQMLQTTLSDSDIAELSRRHDLVFIAAGAGMQSLWGQPTPDTPEQQPQQQQSSEASLPFKFVKGSNLVYAQDPHRLLREALLAGEYLVPHRGGRILCGATHEHSFPPHPEARSGLSQAEDIDFVRGLIGHKIDRIFPHFTGASTSTSSNPPLAGSAGRGQGAADPDDDHTAADPPADPPAAADAGRTVREALGINSAVRCVSPRSQAGRVPILARSRRYSNVWMCAGFGSRGLIHHALAARLLVEAAVNNDEDEIPAEMRLSSPPIPSNSKKK